MTSRIEPVTSSCVPYILYSGLWMVPFALGPTVAPVIVYFPFGPVD